MLPYPFSWVDQLELRPLLVVALRQRRGSQGQAKADEEDCDLDKTKWLVNADNTLTFTNVSIEWLDAQSKKRKKSLHTNDVDWGAFLIEIALEQLVSTDILKKL